MKRLDDIVRIGKDLLNLHDLRSGFQRIVVQRGSFNIQIEVGAGQVIFRTARSSGQHQFKVVLPGNGGHLLGDLDGHGRDIVRIGKCRLGGVPVAIPLGSPYLRCHVTGRDCKHTLACVQLEDERHIRVILRQVDGERNPARHHIQFIRPCQHSGPPLMLSYRH